MNITTRPLCKALVLLVAPFVTYCVDTSPLSYVPQKFDAGAPVDGPVDAPLIRSCRKCIFGDGEPCRDKYDDCAKLDNCVPVLDCVLDTGCFEYEDLAKRYACGSPCLTKYGVMIGTDPAIQALAAINVCIVNSCSDACFLRVKDP